MHTWNKESPNRYWKPQKSDFWLFYNYSNKEGYFWYLQKQKSIYWTTITTRWIKHPCRWLYKKQNECFPPFGGWLIYNGKACAHQMQNQETGPGNNKIQVSDCSTIIPISTGFLIHMKITMYLLSNLKKQSKQSPL